MTKILNNKNIVLKSIYNVLLERKCTVSTAESCTGGMLATLLTEIPGSSQIFVGGVTVYTSDAKATVLGIPKSLLGHKNAVTEDVVIAMAQSVRKLFSTTYALSTSGIAGPDGGTVDDPVGTIWCGFSGPNRSFALKLSLTGDRASIRQQAADIVLKTFLDRIDEL